MEYYGAHTEEVAAIIARLGTLTRQEAEALHAAYVVAPPGVIYPALYVANDAVLESGRAVYWKAAREAAIDAVPHADYDIVWFEAREAALSAILAIFARDLISRERYELLYGPWATVIEGRE